MSKIKTPVAILVRVSTKKQETDRQIHELREVAASNGWDVVETVEAIISGDAKSRPDLDRIRQMVVEGRIRKLLVHEVSRLSRRNGTAHEFLDFLCENGVSLYWHAQTIETLKPDGGRNPSAGIMFALLAEMSRNERETLVTRIKSGLSEARRRGVRLGRSAGPEASEVALARNADVVKLLRQGYSVRKTAKLTGKSEGLVERTRRHMGLTKPRPVNPESVEPEPTPAPAPEEPASPPMTVAERIIASGVLPDLPDMDDEEEAAFEATIRAIHGMPPDPVLSEDLDDCDCG